MRPPIDNGREVDWGRASRDYAAHRAGYPEAFYDVLSGLGIGRAGQSILDLGTGTGILARAFAGRGAMVTGVDISANQVAEAERLARDEGLDVVFRVDAAETVEVADASFDVVSAGQSWPHLDASIMAPKVRRVLKPGGRLVVTHLLWLSADAIARQSEALVLEHNADWNGAGYDGDMPVHLSWAPDGFELQSFTVMYEPVKFTRESWRGRVRASRGIGATLSAAEVERFDTEHRELLQTIAPSAFEVMHQMSAHVYRPRAQLRQS